MKVRQAAPTNLWAWIHRIHLRSFFRSIPKTCGKQDYLQRKAILNSRNRMPLGPGISCSSGMVWICNSRYLDSLYAVLSCSIASFFPSCFLYLQGGGCNSKQDYSSSESEVANSRLPNVTVPCSEAAASLNGTACFRIGRHYCNTEGRSISNFRALDSLEFEKYWGIRG